MQKWVQPSITFINPFLWTVLIWLFPNPYIHPFKNFSLICSISGLRLMLIKPIKIYSLFLLKAFTTPINRSGKSRRRSRKPMKKILSSSSFNKTLCWGHKSRPKFKIKSFSKPKLEPLRKLRKLTWSSGSSAIS